MTYDVFFAGVGAIVFGTLLSCLLTFYFQKCLLKQQIDFQKKLLEQQLDFQKKQAEADAAQRRQIHDEVLSVFTEFRNMLNTRAMQIDSRLSRLES